MEVKTVARKYKESLLRKCLAQYTHTHTKWTHAHFVPCLSRQPFQFRKAFNEESSNVPKMRSMS